MVQRRTMTEGQKAGIIIVGGSAVVVVVVGAIRLIGIMLDPDVGSLARLADAFIVGGIIIGVGGVLGFVAWRIHAHARDGP